MTTATTIPLGRTRMTPGVADLIEQVPDLAQTLTDWMDRHARGECPHLSDDDRRANDWSVQHGFRVFTSWPVTLPDGETATVWLITEADRSSTTALMPSEY